jgi:hypothetical protein
VSPSINVPADTQQVRLEFHHQYDWGSAGTELVDAGVLEWRRQDAPWEDVLLGEDAGTVVFGGYQATVAAEEEHPLAGQPAWSGNSDGGFVPFVALLNAKALAGQTVQFRWRQVANSGLSVHRWHIDNIVLGAVTSETSSTPFEIVSCVLRGGRLELSWQGAPPRPCVIETCPALGQSEWTPAFESAPGEPNSSENTLSIDLTKLPGYPHRELYFRVRSL